MRLIKDWDAEVQSFDFETSGAQPEYALQPWRLNRNKFWATSLVWLRHHNGALKDFGGLAPDRGMIREMLEEAVAKRYVMLGWNTVFDISVLLAYGFRDLVFRLDWLDGMLLWKEAAIEPEYETARHKKKSYGLKLCVTELLPQFAGYEEDVDFHDASPEARAKLHKYNIRDCQFTWVCAKVMWDRLNEKQRTAALIKADCLPVVAEANLKGMLIDQLAMNALAAELTQVANERLATLSGDGVTEKVVRSPKQLGELLYDKWKLPVLGETKSGARATGKEVLHELAFIDPRAKLLREFREALNNRKKFCERPVEAANYNEDGHAHPLAIVFGTYTGRMTYASSQKRGAKRKETPEAEGESAS